MMFSNVIVDITISRRSFVFSQSSLTREVEEDGKLAFLDCLVSRDENTLRTTVYRKPTHTDRLLDESSYNPTSHKGTTIKTLTRRPQLVCNTPDSLSDENKYLRRVFDKNNHKDDFIRRNAHRPTETNANSYDYSDCDRTSRTRLKPSCGSYNPTTSA